MYRNLHHKETRDESDTIDCQYVVPPLINLLYVKSLDYNSFIETCVQLCPAHLHAFGIKNITNIKEYNPIIKVLFVTGLLFWIYFVSFIHQLDL